MCLPVMGLSKRREAQKIIESLVCLSDLFHGFNPPLLKKDSQYTWDTPCACSCRAAGTSTCWHDVARSTDCRVASETQSRGLNRSMQCGASTEVLFGLSGLLWFIS